jgi:SAM-dependent methyltransferase
MNLVPTPAQKQQMAHEQFETLGALLNERTFHLIQALGIDDGWRCWEAGAGGASVPSWLCERVGPTGWVLASDVDTVGLEETTDHPPYAIQRHDLTVDAPPATDFDLVHARLVLEHLTDPCAALATLVAALRPGGWVLVESSDPKLQPLACPDEVGPRQTLANKLRNAVWELFAQPPCFGRTLPRLLRDAGLTDIDADAAFSLGGPGPRRMHHTLITRARPAMVAAGLATEDEIGQHLADLDRPDLDIAVFPIVSAWGRRQYDQQSTNR